MLLEGEIPVDVTKYVETLSCQREQFAVLEVDHRILARRFDFVADDAAGRRQSTHSSTNTSRGGGDQPVFAARELDDLPRLTEGNRPESRR